MSHKVEVCEDILDLDSGELHDFVTMLRGPDIDILPFTYLKTAYVEFARSIFYCEEYNLSLSLDSAKVHIISHEFDNFCNHTAHDPYISTAIRHFVSHITDFMAVMNLLYTVKNKNSHTSKLEEFLREYEDHYSHCVDLLKELEDSVNRWLRKKKV